MESRRLNIVGGGLAGLSLAIGLRNAGVPVTVSEAGSYPRHRVCGEFISGVSDDVLMRLGISEAFDGARAPRSLRWISEGCVVHEGHLPVAARAISRYQLDERLARRLVDLGGDLLTRNRIDHLSGEEGWVRTSGREQNAGGTRIGLKAHVRGVALGAELEMHMANNGYAGLVEVEDGWINVCGIFHADRSIRGRGIDLFARYLEVGGLPGLGKTLRDAVIREGAFCAVAGFQPGWQSHRDGELCIGDAERMIPPFTGNGMSMAFEAADVALEPLIAWSRGAADWQATCNHIRRLLAARFRKRMAAARIAEPHLMRETSRDVMQLLLTNRLVPFPIVYSLFR